MKRYTVPAIAQTHDIGRVSNILFDGRSVQTLGLSERWPRPQSSCLGEG